MPRDIREIEARLKAILAKADALLAHAPQDEESTPPTAKAEPQEILPPKPIAPLLISGPTAPVRPPDTTVPIETPTVINLPAAPIEPMIPNPEPAIPDPEPVPIPAPMLDSVVGDNEIPFLIGYPESELKASIELREQLERLEPKFTKMKFYLRAYGSFIYSSDAPLQEAGFGALQRLHRGVLLLITTKRVSSKSIDPLTEELARHGLYFQVVPRDAVSHKAFYFDFLLGLVFFLKAQKKWAHDPAEDGAKDQGEWHD